MSTTYCVNSKSITADRYELHAIGTHLVATFWRDSEKVASVGLISPFTILEQPHTTPLITLSRWMLALIDGGEEMPKPGDDITEGLRSTLKQLLPENLHRTIEQSHTTPDVKPAIYSHCQICDKPLTFSEVRYSDSNNAANFRKDYCSIDCYTWVDRLNAAVDAELAARNATVASQEGQDSPVIRTLDELMGEHESNDYREIHHPFYARANVITGKPK